MKKVVLSIAIAVIATVTFGQTAPKSKAVTNYRVGIATAIPADVYDAGPRVGIGSTFLEASCNPNPAKKFTYTLSAGYFKIVGTTGSYNQIPVLAGVRYTVDKVVYFGAAVGTGIYAKSGAGDPQFAFSPYLGVQKKNISVDARYFNFSGSGNTVKTLSLVFSYTL